MTVEKREKLSRTVEKKKTQLHAFVNRTEMVLQTGLLLRREVVANPALVRLFSRMRSFVVDESRLVSAAVQTIAIRALVGLVVGMTDHVETQLRVVGSSKTAVGVGTEIGSFARVVAMMIVHVLQNGRNKGAARV